MTIALLVLGVAFLLFCDRSEGFRSQEEKNNLASRLVAGGSRMKPEYEAMKTAGLDGAEFYEVRQLWNNQKFTKENIAKVL
jgi:hypothetical protein